MPSPTLTAQNALKAPEIDNLASQAFTPLDETGYVPTVEPETNAGTSDASGVEPAGYDDNYVYSYGTITARFPSLSLEKEFYQAFGTNPSSVSGSQAFDVDDLSSLQTLNEMQSLNGGLYTVLSKPENQYIAREMCWTLTTPAGNEIYVIDPGGENGLTQLINALQPDASGNPIKYAYIGYEMAQTTNPQCNGNDRISTHLIRVFDPALNNINQKIPTAGTQELSSIVTQCLQLLENNGNSDTDRALNFVLVNDVQFYERTYGEHYPTQNGTPVFSLISAKTVPLADSRLDKILIKVCFQYESESSGAVKWGYSIIDTSSAFPFLVSDFTRLINRQ